MLGRVALLGDRTGTWLDEAEQAEFAGLETPFAIVHKTTLHVIKEERDKDVARRPPSSKYTRKTAAQLYQRVASAVERIMVDRWWRAHAQRHKDGGKAMLCFRKQWEAPGLVAIPLEGGAPKLLLFLHDTTRARYKRKGDSLRSRHFRNQAYAPPMNLPDGTVSIFTDGSAEPRKPGHMFPPAGFGFAAVTGGNGHEHKGGWKGDRMQVRTGGPKHAQRQNGHQQLERASRLHACTAVGTKQPPHARQSHRNTL